MSQMAVDESRRMSVGLINNDFDVDEFEQDEEKQAEEERIGDDNNSDSEDSNNEQGCRDAMPVPVKVRVVRDVPGPSQEQHAMPV